jgi:hypothetical protein
LLGATLLEMKPLSFQNVRKYKLTMVSRN